MAAMTGAEFRRRDACRARGPNVSTTVGARGWSVETKWRGGRRGAMKERAEEVVVGLGVALGTTPNPERSLEPLSLSPTLSFHP